jgi:hypothetical protein
MQVVLNLIDQRIINLPFGLIGRLDLYFPVRSVEPEHIQPNNAAGGVRATNLHAIRIGITWARNSRNLHQRLANDH